MPHTTLLTASSSLQSTALGVSGIPQLQPFQLPLLGGIRRESRDKATLAQRKPSRNVGHKGTKTSARTGVARLATHVLDATNVLSGAPREYCQH